MKNTFFTVLFIFAISIAYNAKIHINLLRELSLNGGRADIIVHFVKPIDIAQFQASDDIEMTAKYIVLTLQENAERTQKDVRQFLQEQRLTFDILWITNSIHVRDVSEKIIDKIAQFYEVEQIVANEKIDTAELPKPITHLGNVSDEPQYHVEWVNAPKFWKETGFKGEGIVVANSDTGVMYTHEALIHGYRGYIGNGKFDHNYNWFDPDHVNTTAYPSDGDGHGTHTIAIAAGRQKGVGIAPHAKWIACRSLGRASDGVIKCLQWLLAPTNLVGKHPRTELRPHVTSHSWWCDNCRVEKAVDALTAAGVVFIKSAGNRGPSCKSITEPGFYKNSIAIAALSEKSNTVARFSSRGPTTDGLIKPNYATPGENVFSAVGGFGSKNDSYTKMSGTSMAAPNFNGCVALLWSAVPELVRKIELTKEIFAKTALQQTSTECESEGKIPNNVYGYGTIDVHAAYLYAKKLFNR